MRPAIGLEAQIVQIREVEDGAIVGYNGRWTARGRRRLATICLGYADGYPRNVSGTDAVPGGAALVGGVLIGDVPSYRVDNMPYGGVKDSGLGREGVKFAMEDMTEIRNLVIRRHG